MVLRDTDFIARIGGDEFAVLIQHTDLAQAKAAHAASSHGHQ